jgi:hypothetical protein
MEERISETDDQGLWGVTRISLTTRFRKTIDYAPVWLLFILGFALVILRPLGSHVALIPGDLGDARFNNYVLEHFYQWVTGLTRDYWNAPFFFPFPRTITFSDNLLGSAPFYVLFRWIGFDMSSAFQGWYIFGCLLNFSAAGYVLWRLAFKPLGIGIGAFFFAFGLPLLAQENHAQLLYHFCIPLACYALWRFYQAPRLHHLVSLAAWLVWQFYLTIYMGIFLILLLAAITILLPFIVEAETFLKRLAIWPRRLMDAWAGAHLTEKVFAVLSLAILSLGLWSIIQPYYQTSTVYGFSRSWEEVSRLLPRWQSYLLADHSQLWGSISSLFSDLPLPHEHQLFPGLAAVLLILVGIIMRFHTQNTRLAWLHFSAALALIALTLQVSDHSLYWLVWRLPGMNSLRAITRIILVIMWPLSLFMAWVADGVIQRFRQQRRWMLMGVYLVTGLLVAESVFYSHSTYDKTIALARLDSLRQQIPVIVPQDPILFVARDQQEAFWAKELDAMLLAQQMGWPTLNGYSGNDPPGYQPADSCKQLPARIENYMEFAGISSPTFYLDMIKRVVPIGFADCHPDWWIDMP